MAAQGRIDFQAFLFANVGDDSEHPTTLRYIRDHAAPHGIDLRELHRIRRDGSTETLYGRLMRDMRREQPVLFTKACRLETAINNRRARLGKDPVYLTRYSAPLADVTSTTDTLAFDDGDGTCDSGWCFP